MNIMEMNLSYSGLTIFILLLVNTLEVYTILARSDYPKLIFDVRHLYGTSSVMILHNEKVESKSSIFIL